MKKIVLLGSFFVLIGNASADILPVEAIASAGSYGLSDITKCPSISAGAISVLGAGSSNPVGIATGAAVGALIRYRQGEMPPCGNADNTDPYSKHAGDVVSFGANVAQGAVLLGMTGVSPLLMVGVGGMAAQKQVEYKIHEYDADMRYSTWVFPKERNMMYPAPYTAPPRVVPPPTFWQR